MEGVKNAKRKNRKLRTGEVDWSPKITWALQLMKYWKLVLLWENWSGEE